MLFIDGEKELKVRIEGNKVTCFSELNVLIEEMLSEVDVVDKYILLHVLTDLINKSIKGGDNNE